MENTQTRQPMRGLTFEDVWATIMETEQEIRETGRIVRELSKALLSGLIIAGPPKEAGGKQV